MAVNYRSPINPREFILGFGVQGVGKSKMMLDIARKCKGDTFFVWDNDNSTVRLLSTAYQDIAEREDVDDRGMGVAYGNVVVYDAEEDDWEEYLEWLAKARKVVKWNDWISVDSSTPTWQGIQSYFSDKVFGEDIADYFLKVRLRMEQQRGNGGDKKNMTVFEGWVDWPVINKLYTKSYTHLKNMPCHVIMTAELTKIGDEDKKDKELMATFGSYGVKPAGQKRLGHKPMTVLLLTKNRVGEYYMTTVKDRGREEMEEVGWGDFVKDYMGPVAGWKMKKEDD